MKTRAFKLRNDMPEGENSLSGYVFRYDEVADYMGEERMSPDMTIHVSPEAFLLRGHDPDKILGKVGKNLEFENRDDGLYFKVKSLPDTELARETMELIKAEILDGVSVGFMDKKSSMDADGVQVFEKIEVKEISIVSMPAYDSGRIDKKAKLVIDKKQPYKKVKEPMPPEMY